MENKPLTEWPTEKLTGTLKDVRNELELLSRIYQLQQSERNLRAALDFQAQQKAVTDPQENADNNQD